VKLTRRKRKPFDDFGASSDIAFLLIIYFMVIAGFNINMGFLMNLPAKDSVRFIPRGDLLRFELDRTGTLLYRGTVLDQAAAEGTIKSAGALRPNLAILLDIAPEAPWQRVVSFVELAQKLKVENFSFVMGEKIPPGGSR
jgi:biopolymer transport protein ExbD